VIEPRRSPSNRTPRVPYASVAAALKFPGRCRLPNGELKDRRDVDNGCQCRSYIEILTAGRWRALGFYVRGGEHANFRGGKQKTIPLFCACQVVNKHVPHDGMADLGLCNACDEPAELDSNGLCADCASVSAGTGGFETMPTMVEAPTYDSEPASAPPAPDYVETTRPAILAESPAQIIGGVPVVRLQLVRDSAVATKAPDITGPADSVTIFRDYIGNPDREHVVCLAVNTKNQPVGIHTVSIGSLNSSIIAIREVFKAAVMSNAAAIILCHNHPSGDPTPSAEDVAITRKIREAGVLLDIELLDHIVLGDPGFVSLRERGLGFAA